MSTFNQTQNNSSNYPMSTEVNFRNGNNPPYYGTQIQSVSNFTGMNPPYHSNVQYPQSQIPYSTHPAEESKFQNQGNPISIGNHSYTLGSKIKSKEEVS